MTEQRPAREDTTDIAIAGGSFAGLAMALAAAAALGPGGRIAIVDATSLDDGARADDDGRALAISAATRNLLAALGVWPALDAHAQAVNRIEITDSSLQDAYRPALLGYDNQTEAGAPASYIVENRHLRRALVERVRASPSVALISGATAADIRADELGAVVRLDSRGTIAAQLVIAADGRRSPLRTAAGIRTVGWSYPQVGIVTIVGHEAPHGGVAVQHFLPAGPFAILPLPGNRACVTWTEEAERGRAIAALDDAGFLAELERRFGHRLGALRLDGPRSVWPLEMHLPRALIGRRLALIGDAARGVHPLAGQGLNLAMRDVAALADVIADAAGLGLDLGNGEMLERYERWRRADGTLSAAGFDMLNRLFAGDNAVVRTARSAGLGLVDRMPGLKQMLVSEAAGLTGEVPRLLKGELPA